MHPWKRQPKLIQGLGNIAQDATSNQLMKRLTGRLRYGLLTQEILGRLSRLGLRFVPYTIVDESAGALVDYEGEDSDSVMRPLDAGEMHRVANMPHRKQNAEDVLSRLSHAECFGAFVGDTLAGYTWSRYDRIARSQGRIQLHRLVPGEAYLFDMYVDKQFRGMSLAPHLRHRLFRHLAEQGIHRFYSISDYFNRSSRRFKDKLGAREIELRIGVRVWSLIDADFLLRRYEKTNPMNTKRAYFA